MPRKKKTDDPIGVGLTAKQMRRKKPINADLLVDIDPLTPNQEKFFTEYDAGKHLFCLLYTSPSPRDRQKSRMPSSA